MATYLFLWNPKKWSWTSIDTQIKRLEAGDVVKERWSTGNRKKGINDGDRFLMMKLGEEPKGIIGYGTFDNLRQELHWDSEKAKQGETTAHVDLNFEFLNSHPLIEEKELNKRFDSAVSTWTPGSSGNLIPDDVADTIIQIINVRKISKVSTITQPVLFARIGYMEYYQGAFNGDVPKGGGSFNNENTGFEACNFLDVNGKVYGYYQPAMNSGKVNLERIDPSNQNLEKVDNVLVIFFSTLPKILAQQNFSDDVISSSAVIIGWYTNATVFREPQKIDRKIDGVDQDTYFIEADTSDAFLLPVDKRLYKIGHGIKGEKEGNPGQSNSFYIYGDNKKLKDLSHIQNKWIGQAIDYVKTYSGPFVKTDEERAEQNAYNGQFRASSNGAGFQSNALIRVAVEKYAMHKAEKALTEKGYKVKATHENGQSICGNSPYDMKAYKDGREYLVEVKGTQLDGSSVILTHNEVELHDKPNNRVILCVVHSIKLDDEKINHKSGEVVIHDPWILDKGKLKEISYFYTF
ncbi:protein NO VEIN domain-containing protein [Acinetobacter guillouiae]|uniref:protein NO VEIN domain-containing protein n=1 Tax=Acinetobacter guillouiae TaxID=106649 RepID=UPI001CD38855|nr:DUF3883 domain-containing protein [Acinetobacter guillouiae]